MKPVILCILDGVGQGDGGPGDAVAAANTPHLDRLRAEHPWTLLKAHGKAVGLPTDKDMGNSEVCHADTASSLTRAVSARSQDILFPSPILGD